MRGLTILMLLLTGTIAISLQIQEVNHLLGYIIGLILFGVSTFLGVGVMVTDSERD